eukprot:TRINITY_DN75440_c0_g1_i1.p1 TRINITY_DN75440_c0_g1~~TRINITY_DN75440_c0_g1_i1.p1  ORF type:complete len:192 (-),score=26.72 TRINITY_DN75440_c0_g1_i1:89-664(-)
MMPAARPSSKPAADVMANWKIDDVVDGQIWLSGMDAVNEEKVRQHGITHILCVAKEAQRPLINGVVYANFRGLHLEDDGSSCLKDKVARHLVFIEGAISSGGRVLVHCRVGVNRSASVIIVYLMARRGMEYEDALKFVQSGRGVVNPVPEYREQLRVLPRPWLRMLRYHLLAHCVWTKVTSLKLPGVSRRK